MPNWLLPIVKSIVLCEDVLPGPKETGNVHLINAFSAIRPRGEFPFPYHPTKFCIFLELTDAEGAGNGWVAIRDAATDEIIFSGGEHAIHFEHRLRIKRVNFAIKGCVFPAPGLHLIEFFLQDQWIVDRPLEIKV